MSPLENLNDIIEPATPSAWPPAFIYWILLLTTLFVVTGAFFAFKKYKKEYQKQQLLLNELNKVQQSQASFITLNQLLKGVCLRYFPRSDVASLHGEAWFNFLQQYASTPLFDNKETFTKRLYGEISTCTADDYEAVRQWIKALPQQIKKNQKVDKHV